MGSRQVHYDHPVSCGCRRQPPIDLSKVIKEIGEVPGVSEVSRTTECNADLKLVVDNKVVLLKLRPGKPSCSKVIRVMPSSDPMILVRRLVNEARR